MPVNFKEKSCLILNADIDAAGRRKDGVRRSCEVKVGSSLRPRPLTSPCGSSRSCENDHDLALAPEFFFRGRQESLAIAGCDAALGKAVSIGWGDDISIGELVETIARRPGGEIRVESDEQRIRPAASEVEPAGRDGACKETLGLAAARLAGTGARRDDRVGREEPAPVPGGCLRHVTRIRSASLPRQSGHRWMLVASAMAKAIKSTGMTRDASRANLLSFLAQPAAFRFISGAITARTMPRPVPGGFCVGRPGEPPRPDAAGDWPTRQPPGRDCFITWRFDSAQGRSGAVSSEMVVARAMDIR